MLWVKLKNNALIYMKYIDVPTFIISFAIGMFFVYIMGTKKRVIFIYPTPDNINDINYKDSTGNCYSFKAENVDCPTDDKIENYNVQ